MCCMFSICSTCSSFANHTPAMLTTHPGEHLVQFGDALHALDLLHQQLQVHMRADRLQRLKQTPHPLHNQGGPPGQDGQQYCLRRTDDARKVLQASPGNMHHKRRIWIFIGGASRARWSAAGSAMRG
eukprot:scaffold29064_cov16-Tisochrysis_lutea.AAC.1